MTEKSFIEKMQAELLNVALNAKSGTIGRQETVTKLCSIRDRIRGKMNEITAMCADLKTQINLLSTFGFNDAIEERHNTINRLEVEYEEYRELFSVIVNAINK